MAHSRNMQRRTLITKASMFAAALFGLGVAGNAEARVTAPPGTGVAPLTLQGVNWQLTYPDRPRGVLPQPGQRSSVFGELLGADGEKVGEFYASSMHFGRPFGPTDLAAAAMETHQFTFHDGSIVGIGTLGDLYGAPSAHAIIGGTGRYEGASGSYIARQRPIELGGDGTADFDLHIILRSA